MGTQRNGFSKRETFILAVDVGTTSIRCHVYDKSASIRGSCSTKVSLLYPQPGWVEIDPDDLWKGFVTVVKGAVQDSGLQMCQMESLGISTQRATFMTWDRNTGEPFHNFITWQDLRAAELVKSWNRSCTMKKRFLAASLVVFTTQHVSLRLVWALNNIPQLRQAVEDDSCYFGTIDTWLLYKLTKGLVHATDYSNASATAIFDSYQMCWSGFLCSLLSIPLSILPSVQNTSHKFGTCDPSIFGVPIPIMSLMADQQAAMFGECCFDIGLYPLVGWKIGADVVYLAEGNAAGTGAAIKWAQDLELFSDVKETEAIATSVKDSDGVYFVPSFSGLQAPLNDPKACASFMGLKPSTTKKHLVRAILESIAFRNKQLFDVMLRETRIPITKIRADGGVCTNNFIMQLTADLLGRVNQIGIREAHAEVYCRAGRGLFSALCTVDRRGESEESGDDETKRKSLNGEVDSLQAPSTVPEESPVDMDTITLDPDEEDVDLVHCRIGKIEGLENLDSLVSLRELDLYDNQIRKLENLQALTELEQLDVSFNLLRKIEGLECLTKIKKLFLLHNKITSIANLDQMASLQMLELGSNRIRVIENLDSLSSLESLFLGTNKITQLQNLDGLHSLTVLSIQSNRITKLEGLQNLVNLRELYLSHNGIEVIEGLENNMNDNQIDNWADLDELKNAKGLETVYLERNPLQKDPQYRRKIMLALPSVRQIDATFIRF
ncbi:hypothetical protein H4Q32_003931 [Labeo rohita]|uniref:glycerol kinase n=1 Tax=Labeo rohita TaxID=84645 RepID=A0ABQ8MXB1_LABRO|nr:hypothetical protein H4Q32_003931 [Labeo rohita]